MTRHLTLSALLLSVGLVACESERPSPPEFALEHMESVTSQAPETAMQLAQLQSLQAQEVLPEQPGAGSFFLEVRPNENLMLIAEWAEIPVDALLDANPEIDAREALYPGQSVRVPVADDSHLQGARSQWLNRRLERLLAQHGGVAGVEEVRVRSGDTAWALAEQVGLPVWVLAAYNSELDLEALRVGDRVRRPVLMDSVQLAEPELEAELIKPGELSHEQIQGPSSLP